MEINLKTLTPLHIGNGEELFALDYVKHNSFYYRLNQKKFLTFISKDVELLKKYNNWVLEKAKQIDDLKEKKNKERDKARKSDYNQELSKLQKSFNLLNFIEKNTNRKNEFIQFLDNSDDVIKIRFNTEPKNQIRGFIKSPTNKPYIPGTSLKGAIRTALLYKFLINSADIITVKQLIEKEINKILKAKKEALKNRDKFNIEKYKKSFADKIEQLAFYCETVNQDGIRKKNDEKFDIMKFLSVSDGILDKDELILANIDLYLVSKTRTNQGFVPIASKQTQAPCVEAIPEHCLIKTDIDFDIWFFLNIKDKLVNNSIKQGKDLIWIDLKQKVKNIFNLNIDTLTKENIEEKKREVINYIFSALKQFSNAQLDAEEIWINEFSEKDRNKLYKSKINSGFKSLNEHKGNLIHLGFASGFYGITEFIYLKSDNELKDLFKQVMELFFIGDRPGAKHTTDKPYIANPDKFPKSRRLTEINNSLKPLGWLLISDGGENHNLSHFAETTEVNQIKEFPKEITPEFRNVTFKKGKGAVLEAVVLANDMVEVYMPDKSKKTVKLASGSADVGKVIEVTIFPDGKGNFNHASFKSLKK